MRDRVAYVTAHSPFGSTEPFAIAELLEVGRSGIELAVYPVRADGPIHHEDARSLIAATVAPALLSPSVLFGAISMVIRKPIRSWRAISAVVIGLRPSVALKNLAVVPKGLWLGRHLERTDVVHIHAYWSSTPATVGYVASAVSGIPFSMTAHSWDIPENNALERKIRHSVFTRVVAEDGRRKMRRQVSAAALEKVRVIHLGVDVPASIQAPRHRDRPVIAVPASLLPVKGHAVLLAALERLTRGGVPFECRLYGDGPLREEIARDISHRSLTGAVRIEGQVPHDALLAMYRAGDVDVVALPSVVLPGDVREGIPVALIEAMAHGIPVVATATGGIPELVVDGSGLLVPERDDGELAAALSALLTSEPDRRRIGAVGRDRVRRSFDAHRQTRAVLAAMGVDVVPSES